MTSIGPVGADEALAFGLANRVVADGTAREMAVALAREIAEFFFSAGLPIDAGKDDEHPGFLGAAAFELFEDDDFDVIDRIGRCFLGQR